MALARPESRLSLLGRDTKRLEATAAMCQARGSTVRTFTVDVRDRERMAEVIADADADTPLDLVIANAGISGATADQGGRQEIVLVNLLGVMNTVEPAIPLMRQRRSGQIAIISSLAGFRGMPPAPAYCASKAGARLYGEGLRPLLRGDGVKVNTVCPGFVETPLTAQNPFAMPMIMPVERAARIILEGLARNRARIAFPWPVYAAMRVLAGLPPAWSDWLLRRIPVKEGR